MVPPYNTKGFKQLKNLGNRQGRTPLLLQDVETNATIAVDIWVKNFCPECNLQESNHEQMERYVCYNFNKTITSHEVYVNQKTQVCMTRYVVICAWHLCVCVCVTSPLASTSSKQLHKKQQVNRTFSQKFTISYDQEKRRPNLFSFC